MRANANLGGRAIGQRNNNALQATATAVLDKVDGLTRHVLHALLDGLSAEEHHELVRVKPPFVCKAQRARIEVVGAQVRESGLNCLRSQEQCISSQSVLDACIACENTGGCFCSEEEVALSNECPAGGGEES